VRSMVHVVGGAVTRRGEERLKMYGAGGVDKTGRRAGVRAAGDRPPRPVQVGPERNPPKDEASGSNPRSDTCDGKTRRSGGSRQFAIVCRHGQRISGSLTPQQRCREMDSVQRPERCRKGIGGAPQHDA
jgi:hypothetical protein